MSESNLRNHTDPSSSDGQKMEPDAITFKAIFENLLGLAIDQLKQVPENARAFQNEVRIRLESDAQAHAREAKVFESEKPFRDLGLANSFSAKLKRASRYSGKSIGTLRNDPQKAGESYAAACFSPGLADPPRFSNEPEPSALLLQVIDQGLLGLPKKLSTEFKKIRLTKKHPSWSQCIQLFREAYSERFTEQPNQRLEYVIPPFLETDQLRTLWEYRVQECRTLTLLSEELDKHIQGSRSTSSADQIQTGVAQSAPYQSLDAQRKGAEAAMGDRQKPAELDWVPGLIVDTENGQVLYRGTKLRINVGEDFKTIECLYMARGQLVRHRNLLRLLRPHEVVVSETAADGSVRDAVSHVNEALKHVKASCTVENIRGRGYKLVIKQTQPRRAQKRRALRD